MGKTARNEQKKLRAPFCNRLAIAIVMAAIFVPMLGITVTVHSIERSPSVQRVAQPAKFGVNRRPLNEPQGNGVSPRPEMAKDHSPNKMARTRRAIFLSGPVKSEFGCGDRI